MKVDNVVFFWALFLFVVEKGHSQEEQTTVGSLEEVRKNLCNFSLAKLK